MRQLALLLFFLIGILFAREISAQNVVQDYIRNAPRQYSPDDPWSTGRVYRNHTGHGGLFYNCDCEEEKRYSPYIYWQSEHCQQPETLKAKLCDIQWQLNEVRQRIRWGACLDKPHYHVPYLPSERFGPAPTMAEAGRGAAIADESDPRVAEAPAERKGILRFK